jgi:hypothetical protein
MPLTKEIYRDEYSQHTKKIFYNDKQQIAGTLEVFKTNGEERGELSVYEYSGESYRLLKYENGTKAYAHFASQGGMALGKTGWYSVGDALSVQDFKYEKGVLIAENYQSREGVKYSISNTYQNGVKVSETTVAADGMVTKINFVYQGKTLLSKATIINDQFSDQINYIYYQDNLLSEEQKFLKYKDNLYLSGQKKFFYNAKKELERTEHYGRYDSTLHLYKVEETIRKGNERTTKHFSIPDLEVVIGHYDLSTMHDQLKRDNMEWAVSVFDKQYITSAKLQMINHTVDAVDDHGNITETTLMHPEKDNEEMAKVLYRNEYNDDSLLEFVISYRMTEDGKAEESSIRKFYYQ